MSNIKMLERKEALWITEETTAYKMRQHAAK